LVVGGVVARVPFTLLWGAFGLVEGIGPDVRTGGDGTAADAFQGACGGADGATIGGGLKAVFCVPDESG
jgi:hypothetical protein